MMNFFGGICCFLLIRILNFTKSSSLPEVVVEQGILRGFYSKTFSNRRIASFEGIPYAKPPLGENRFKEPIPASPWSGTHNATREPPSCLQFDMIFTKSIRGAEDCLYLNVYTPKLPKGNTKEPQLLDVLAFIHGGAFNQGKSGLHGPSILLDKNFVLVTFNYRLGPLGFLSTEDSVVPGNNGLKDQVLALKWIQKNIAAFGGNPNSVTVGGQSAGGASCHFHLLSPLSKGLFHRAICMSGVALNPWALAEKSKEKAMLIATDLGCPVIDSKIMIDCLRDKPAENIVLGIKKLLYWGIFPIVLFAPVIEQPSATAFISDTPVNIVRSKNGSDVPVIFSFTHDDGSVGTIGILPLPGMFAEMKMRWNELIPNIMYYNYTEPSDKKFEIAQKIKEKYQIDDTFQGHKTLTKMIGDRMFESGISKISKLSASVYSSPVYVYRFSYKGKYSLTDFLSIKEDLGVFHGDDLLYTLGFLNLNLLDNASDLEMSKQMLDVFESFFRNGSLQGENWEALNKQMPKIVFTDIKGPKKFDLITVDELGEESFWDSLDSNENLE